MTELSILIWIGVTLLFIGFFAGYEIAFISANRLAIELKKKQGKRSGILLSGYMEHPALLVSTCLIGLNIFLVIYGLLFHELLRKTLWNPLGFENEYLKLGFDTFLSSLVVLLLGEFLPKAIFRARNDSAVALFSPLIQLFHRLFLPLTRFFVRVSQWILTYLFNVRVNERNNVFNKVDLEHFFQQTKEQDEDSPTELNTELFENALSLPSVKIRKCLVPRTEIEGIDIHTPVS
ncbi:MAG TPA: CNNM domain-containing protein, partial [Sediminibacterium sp.]|nr:CNNM domain-containing protein [Sediminibacterium sp.]